MYDPSSQRENLKRISVQQLRTIYTWEIRILARKNDKKNVGKICKTKKNCIALKIYFLFFGEGDSFISVKGSLVNPLEGEIAKKGKTVAGLVYGCQFLFEMGRAPLKAFLLLILGLKYAL